MRQQAAQQGVAVTQAQQDKAALTQRLESLTTALKAADEAYEKEHKRRRSVEDECADLLADLREERRRFAPLSGSGRAADEQRFAPPKRAWSPSRARHGGGGGGDRWAPVRSRDGSSFSSRSRSRY